MVRWWWLLIALLVGVVCGIFILSLVAAADDPYDDYVPVVKYDDETNKPDEYDVMDEELE